MMQCTLRARTHVHRLLATSGICAWAHFALVVLFLCPLLFSSRLQHPFAIVGDELKSLRVLLENIRTVSLYHSASFTASEHAIVVKLLQWPTEQILAVMDAVRVLMMHGAANQTLGDDERVHTHLLQHAKAGRDSGKDTHQILLFKILSNWVAKRQRSPAERSEAARRTHIGVCASERNPKLTFACSPLGLCLCSYDPPSAPKAVVDHLARAIEGLSSAAASQTENVALAFVMLLHKSVTHQIAC